MRAILLPLLICFAAAPSPLALAADPPPAPSPEDDRALLVAEASRLERKGDYRKAEKLAREALGLAPGDREALFVLTDALVAVGRYEEAEAEIRAVLTALGATAEAPSPPPAAPESPPGPPSEGGPLTPTLSRGEREAAALTILGEVLLERGRVEEAIDALTKAIDLDLGGALPGTWRARAAIAEAALLRGDRATAEAHARWLLDRYSAASDLAPAELVASARGALVADQLPALKGEYAERMYKYAQRMLQEAYDRDPGDPRAHARWAKLYLEKWDLPEARRLIREAQKISPDLAEAHALHAETLLQDLYGGTDRYAEARRSLERALATNPSLVRAHILLAELLITDALYDEALAALDKAEAVNPRDVRAAATRAAIHLIRGEDEAFAAIERRVLARDAAGTAAGAELYARAASVVDSKFRYALAHELARKAVLLDPDYWPAYGVLGLAAMRTGDEAEARRYLEKAYANDPFDRFVLNLLTLLDHLDKEFVTTESEHFVYRLDRRENDVLLPLVRDLCERSYRELTARYKVDLGSQKILFELYPNLNDFSVRAVAHRFIPASGVTFAHVIAVVSPQGLPPGAHNWGRVVWHEMAHVMTLEATDHKIPRWLTEGISVFEEMKGHPSWLRESDAELMVALARGRLLPLRELDSGFSKPKFPNQVLLSYYQGGLICEFLEKTFGFDSILRFLDGYKRNKPLDEIVKGATGGLTPEQLDERFLAFARETFAVNTFRPAYGEEDLDRLRRAAKKAPKDAKAQLEYARAALDRDRVADAETAAGRALAVAPEDPDAVLVRAGIAAGRKQWARARELAASALAGGTTDPFGAHVLMIRILEAEEPKDSRKVVQHLEALRELFPRLPSTHRALANAWAGLGEEAKKIEALERYAALASADGAVRVELAAHFEKAGEIEKAIRYLEEALYTAPIDPRVNLILGRACLKLGDVAGARAALLRVEKVAPKDHPEVKALREAIEKAGT